MGNNICEVLEMWVGHPENMLTQEFLLIAVRRIIEWTQQYHCLLEQANDLDDLKESQNSFQKSFILSKDSKLIEIKYLNCLASILKKIQFASSLFSYFEEVNLLNLKSKFSKLNFLFFSDLK